MTRARGVVAAAAFAVVTPLAACGGGDRVADGAGADTASAFSTPSAVPVEAVPGSGGRRAAGNLQSPEGPAVGTVVLEEQEGGTLMRLSMAGVAPGTEMQASIVRGSCAEPGQEEQQGTVIFETRGSGDAEIEENLPLQIGTLLDNRHSVRVTAPPHTSHQGTTPAERPTYACAELSAG